MYQMSSNGTMWHSQEGGLDMHGQPHGVLGCWMSIWQTSFCEERWRSIFKQYLPVLLNFSWEEFRQLWQRSVPLYLRIFRRMKLGTLPSALTWKVAPLNAYCNCKLQLFWSFDTLHSFMGTCILKIKHLRHIYYDIFNLIFNNEWH